MTAKERQFALPGLTLAAREWGGDAGVPVLAIHGWLDNAGTFDRLAPLLPQCRLIALDCAGHGASADRSPDASYNIWQEVGDVAEVAEQLGWQRFHLLGHSRGAAIAALFAGTFPARVESLTLIEGAIPILGRAEEAPGILAQSLIETKQRRARSGRVFADRAAAIRERADGFSKVGIEAAEILARRSLQAVPGGYRWRADQRLKATSQLHLTAVQVESFLARIEAPVLLFLAAESPFGHEPWFTQRLRAIRDLDVRHLRGGHHLHLEGAETEIAAAMRQLLTRR